MQSQPEISEASQETSIVQERLNWKLAYRDDARVAQGLYAGQAIEEMHELSDASAYLGSPRMAEMVTREKVTLEEMGCAHALNDRGDPPFPTSRLPSRSC